MCCDAPSVDTSRADAVAEANAAIAKESLDWAKQRYAEDAPLRERAAKTAFDIADQQLLSMRTQDALAKDYDTYNKETFRPLEKSIVADAQSYDTAEKREEAAGTAMADVAQQSALQKEVNNRDLMRRGVNPNSGKFDGLSIQTSMGEAMAKAQASKNARDKVETVGRALKMDAASLGRGLASNQATSAGIALNAGNSASSNAGMPLQQSINSGSVMNTGFNTAINANNSAGNIYGNSASLQQRANESSNAGMAALGQVVGQLGAAYIGSDVNAKENIKPISDEKALAAAEKIGEDVKEWDYKPGMGDGGTHIGPMAQTVNKHLGDKAAPGGKMIDLISMNGVSMKSIAALSKKVDRLAEKVGEKS
jgi:hypothetical protein